MTIEKHEGDAIFVTRPLLPPLEEFVRSLEDIWRSGTLTNCGPVHERLESALVDELGVPYISLFANGTLALITAIQALGLTGEVITTPFSFVATTHAIQKNGLTPVFADIDPNTFNLDPRSIERAVTEKTSAIVPVHCYGYPCDTDRIGQVADKFRLKVVYDAAHAFGVRDAGGSVLRHGDFTILSFHATKVFSTVEGGAVVSRTAADKARIDRLKNFGFAGETSIVDLGQNAKMSEIHAAFGLTQLRHLDGALRRRREIAERYVDSLGGVTGITVPAPTRGYLHSDAGMYNFSYFPILVSPQFRLSRDGLFEHLKSRNVFARRYFYPLISNMPMYAGLPSSDRDTLAVAARVAEQVLCLPIHPELTDGSVDVIARLIQEAA